MTELVPVRVRDCPDGTHPEGDSVWLRPTLSLQGGLTAAGQVRQANGDDQVLYRLWMDTFARYGAVAWNLHDEGQPEPWPFDVERLLDNFEWAFPVADKADDMYRPGLFDPLAKRRPSSSPRGQTAPSTSSSPNRASRRSSRPRGSAGQQSAANP